MEFILWYYLDQTAAIQSLDQLFICHGRRTHGAPFSKQTNRLAHWVVDITMPYYWTPKWFNRKVFALCLNLDDATVLCDWRAR